MAVNNSDASLTEKLIPEEAEQPSRKSVFFDDLKIPEVSDYFNVRRPTVRQ